MVRYAQPNCEAVSYLETAFCDYIGITYLLG